MYIQIALLKETQPHERRVALVPSVAAKLLMQAGAGQAVKLADSMYDAAMNKLQSLGTELAAWEAVSRRADFPKDEPDPRT